MAMSKKDFEQLAHTIRNQTLAAPVLKTKPFTEYQVETLAGFCKGQNPRFDYGRFLDAVYRGMRLTEGER